MTRSKQINSLLSKRLNENRYKLCANWYLNEFYVFFFTFHNGFFCRMLTKKAVSLCTDKMLRASLVLNDIRMCQQATRQQYNEEWASEQQRWAMYFFVLPRGGPGRGEERRGEEKRGEKRREERRGEGEERRGEERRKRRREEKRGEERRGEERRGEERRGEERRGEERREGRGGEGRGGEGRERRGGKGLGRGRGRGRGEGCRDKALWPSQ